MCWAHDTEGTFFSKMDAQKHVQILDMSNFDVKILRKVPERAPIRFVEDIRQNADFGTLLNSTLL